MPAHAARCQREFTSMHTYIHTHVHFDSIKFFYKNMYILTLHTSVCIDTTSFSCDMRSSSWSSTILLMIISACWRDLIASCSMYVCMYVCVYVYVSIHAHSTTHTHTHTHYMQNTYAPHLCVPLYPARAYHALVHDTCGFPATNIQVK
jgi:hypothetical protein